MKCCLLFKGKNEPLVLTHFFFKTYMPKFSSAHLKISRIETVNLKICFSLLLEMGLSGRGICHTFMIRFCIRKRDKKKEMPKKLYKQKNGECKFRFWRNRDVAKLSAASIKSEIESINTEIFENNLHLFYKDTRSVCFMILCVYQFLQFPLHCFRLSWRYNWNYRQIRYIRTRHSYLYPNEWIREASRPASLAVKWIVFNVSSSFFFAQVDQKFGILVKACCPEMVMVSVLLVRALENPASDLKNGTATLKVGIQSTNWHFISVFAEGFPKHNTCSTDTIHECCILVFDRISRDMTPSKIYSSSTEIHLRQ